MRECFLQTGRPLPRTRAEFTALIEQHRSELNDKVTALVNTALNFFKEWRAARQALSKLSAPTFRAAVQDIEQQLTALLSEDFLRKIEQPWLGHLPRYLKAIVKRIDRLAGNVARDAQLQQQVAPLTNEYRQLLARNPARQVELEKLRWMIEEFRVSLFAQELKTAVSVSARRLNEQLELAKKEAL